MFQYKVCTIPNNHDNDCNNTCSPISKDLGHLSHRISGILPASKKA